MCTRTGFIRSFPLVAAVVFAASTMHAQERVSARPSDAGATSTATTVTTTTVPAWHDSVPDKLITAKVHDGVLVVDGLVAKVRLNYEVRDAAFMYVFLPGTGTAVISLSPLANSEKVKDLFHGSKMSFSVGGHTVELESQGVLGENGATGYVMLDRSTKVIARMPMFGFGMTTRPPYVWPLSGKPATAAETSYSTAIPSNMLPRTAPAPAATPQP